MRERYKRKDERKVNPIGYNMVGNTLAELTKSKDFIMGIRFLLAENGWVKERKMDNKLTRWLIPLLSRKKQLEIDISGSEIMRVREEWKMGAFWAQDSQWYHYPADFKIQSVRRNSIETLPSRVATEKLDSEWEIWARSHVECRFG